MLGGVHAGVEGPVQGGVCQILANAAGSPCQVVLGPALFHDDQAAGEVGTLHLTAMEQTYAEIEGARRECERVSRPIDSLLRGHGRLRARPTG